MEDIKVVLDSKGYNISEKTVYNMIREDGFSKLPRRTKIAKKRLEKPLIKAEKSVKLEFESEDFKSAAGGTLALLPYIERYGIRNIIEKSSYPETNSINKLSSLLSFIALKASNTRRYSADNLWCMDRGLGLFAGLNVLPKAAWFTSYSHRITPQMNRDFLKALHSKWSEEELLGDTSNLDFTTIPYWGDGKHLENNWAGKRGKALSSMLAVLAHDPDTGIINYSDADVKHKNESDIVIEFLDFYEGNSVKNSTLKYLVFDGKFTTYQNLNKLNKQGIKFVTIRRRGKNIIDKIENLEVSSWRKISVECSGNKKRTLKVFDNKVSLRGYEGDVRQICITGHGKIKPAIIITNDFILPVEKVVRKYSKRWIIEKTINEQIEFFHLNKVSSSMVIKVDFDLTMSILTHNIFRLFARDLERYSQSSDQTIYETFLRNVADVSIKPMGVEVSLKKKRALPQILETMEGYKEQIYPWLEDKRLLFYGSTFS